MFHLYFQPVFYLRDRNGNESLEYGEQANQFVEMFRNYCRMFCDLKQIAEEISLYSYREIS